MIWTGGSGRDARPGKERKIGMKGAGKLLFILPAAAVALALAAAAFVFVGSYSRVYAAWVDYDDSRSRGVTRLDLRADVDDEGGSVRLTLDIAALNGYIDAIDLKDDVSVAGYEVRDLCFDADDQYLYLRLKNRNGKYIDLTCRYGVRVSDGALAVEAEPIRAGEDGGFLSDLVVRGIRIGDIEIPLTDAYAYGGMASRIDEKSEKVSVRRGSLVFKYDMDSGGGDVIAATPAPGGGRKDAWTVMIYMNGSNLEYDPDKDLYFAGASGDLEEMIRGLTSDSVNLLIETGGTLAWYRDGINPGVNQRFVIENGRMTLLSDLDRKNMCDPATLVDFANWAIQAYPADQYALILWDHGGGSLYGYGYDLYYEDDALYLPEIESALDDITSANGITFELFGFDACLMATLETAAMLEPYARYFIASEESEPAHGWNYESIMEVLGDESVVSGDVFGRKIVSSFISQAVQMDTSDEITLSVIDLSMTDEVVGSLSMLAAAITADMAADPSVYNHVAAAIPKLLEFSGTDHYDLEGFAEEMIRYYPELANHVLNALDDAVISKTAGYMTAGAGGLSFYLPFYYPEDYAAFADLYAQIALSPEYTGFVEAMVRGRRDAVAEGIRPVYTVNYDADPYEIAIDPEYDDNYLSNLYIQVWEVYETGGELLYYDLGYDAWVSETDTPHVYRENFSYWPSLFGALLSVEVTYFDEERIVYSSPVTVNGYEAELIFTYRFDDMSYAIRGFTYCGGGEGGRDDTVYPLAAGDQVELLYYTYDYYNDDGFYSTMGPYDVTQDNLIITDSPIAESTYALQFVIEDYTGELYFTEYSEFFYSLD